MANKAVYSVDGAAPVKVFQGSGNVLIAGDGTVAYGGPAVAWNTGFRADEVRLDVDSDDEIWVIGHPSVTVPFDVHVRVTNTR